MVDDTVGVNSGGGTTTGTESAVIFPLLNDGGNRRVLTEWIEANEQYELVEDTNAVLTAAYDCLIVDPRSLVERQDAIRERTEQAHHLVPVVLLVEESEEQRVRTELRNHRRGLWAEIDAVVTMPITERQLEDQLSLLQQLRKQSREISAQSGELEILNRVLRHDIRNDLNVLLGWTAMLDDHVDDAGQEYVDRIAKSGRHIVELTEVAGDIAKQIASGGVPDLQPVDLTTVLTEEVQKRQTVHDSAAIDLLTTPPPDLEVWANEMLASVFRNLINNAVQHTDSETPTVEISVFERDDSAIVKIADEGQGISADQKDRIFDEAQKGLDSEGTGLGLYLVETLIDSYGGSVWIEDNEPHGAVFAVELVTTGSQPVTEGTA